MLVKVWRRVYIQTSEIKFLNAVSGRSLSYQKLNNDIRAELDVFILSDKTEVRKQ